MRISKTAINKAGDIIRGGKSSEGYDGAIEIVNNWREAHGKVLDEYFSKCVKMVASIDKSILVAQRLKRLPTIIGKLNRFKGMRLSSMQDIAGARIIVGDMKQLTVVERRIRRWRHLKKTYDYIKNPKPSGYRGKHFIFETDGMLVEIQLRTQLQHLWATSVETLDVFRGSALKEKDDNSYWHDFFCQVSSIFAVTEDAPVISEHSALSLKELLVKFINNVDKHHITTQIVSYAASEFFIDKAKVKEKVKGAYYAVLSLNYNKKEANVLGYKESDYQLAFDEYKSLEQRNSCTEYTVLVAINQINKIREIYPNYFMNLGNFLEMINRILEKQFK